MTAYSYCYGSLLFMFALVDILSNDSLQCETISAFYS